VEKKEIFSAYKSFKKDLKKYEEKSIMQIYQSANVVLCTLTGAGDKTLFNYVTKAEKLFDVLVIDECA
jgi:superfamily I DNA and/or RNA helicase